MRRFSFSTSLKFPFYCATNSQSQSICEGGEMLDLEQVLTFNQNQMTRRSPRGLEDHLPQGGREEKDDVIERTIRI
jgi:hypothetical protein